jgi:calmodulin
MSEGNVIFSDEEIKEAFDTFDLGTNGYITNNEIRVIMEAMGEYVTEEEIDEMVRMLDN